MIKKLTTMTMTMTMTFQNFLTCSVLQFCKFLIPRPLKRGILGASTKILSKDIDEYAFMCGLNFYETDVRTKSL